MPPVEQIGRIINSSFFWNIINRDMCYILFLRYCSASYHNISYHNISYRNTLYVKVFTLHLCMEWTQKLPFWIL